MAIKFFSSLVMFALLLSVSTAFDGRKILSVDESASSSIAPVDTKASNVIEIVRFAVDQYNKEHKLGLTYSDVIEAVAANDTKTTYYNLIISTKGANNLDSGRYNVVVASNSNAKELIVFKELK